MVTLYALKPRFQALLRPFVARLAASGITANQVTIAAACGSLAVGLFVAIARGHPAVFLLLPFWLAIRMALNAVDGMLAREFGQMSRLGACLNELGDAVSDAALLFPFALVPPFGATATAIVVVLALLTEFAGVLGSSIGASRRYDGPLGKSDRACSPERSPAGSVPAARCRPGSACSCRWLPCSSSSPSSTGFALGLTKPLPRWRVRRLPCARSRTTHSVVP